jgi:hypothetical protein
VILVGIAAAALALAVLVAASFLTRPEAFTLWLTEQGIIRLG